MERKRKRKRNKAMAGAGGGGSDFLLFASGLAGRLQVVATSKEIENKAKHAPSTTGTGSAEILNLPWGLGPDSYAPFLDEEKRILEQKHLIPGKALPDRYLPLAQMTIQRQPDLESLLQAEVSKPAFTLESMKAQFMKGSDLVYNEVPVESDQGTAHDSTSLLREPGESNLFVTGKSEYYPFFPGGMQKNILETDDELQRRMQSFSEFTIADRALFKKVPPGLSRGLFIEDELVLAHKAANGAVSLGDVLFSNNSEIDMYFSETNNEEQKPVDLKDEIIEETQGIDEGTVPSEPKEIDGLTGEVDFVETVVDQIKPQSTRKSEAEKKSWAHEVDVRSDFPNFRELVPVLARDFPFELDTFQKHAAYRLERNESVFVAAHTSAGKTVVAEYAIALASRHMTKAIYTSPIKALSNQKFRDFKDTFEDVGILTGDVQINPEAPCLIMTTEILRSMLYRGADMIRDVEFVIFDEVHYVNDAERGVVWEEVIIMLPAHITLILLSATVPNTMEFANWIGRTKKKDIYVISTLKRPVPLEHYLYTPTKKELFKIVDSKAKMLGESYKLAADSLESKSKNAQPYNNAPGRQYFSDMISMLQKKNLLPVVIFTFSKRRCEENVASMTKVDLNTPTERSQIHMFLERSLSRLKGLDLELPQIVRMRDQLARGLGVHHGGLLPIMKESVEILFQQGLIKVLFATETFAMGVNMPARCVVFNGIRKHDGSSFRYLLPGEYTQMSGRAGRRGLDSTGVVIIACVNEVPELSSLSVMITGKPTRLESQFRLTYNMILNLLRVEELRVEDMIKRSFGEFHTQKNMPETEKLLKENEITLSGLPKLECSICDNDIENYYDQSMLIMKLNSNMITFFAELFGKKVLQPGLVIVINSSFYPSTPAIIIRVKDDRPVLRRHTSDADNALSSNQAGSVFTCLILQEAGKERVKPEAHESVLSYPLVPMRIPPLGAVSYVIEDVSLSDIVFISSTNIQIKPDLMYSDKDKAYNMSIANLMTQSISEMKELKEVNFGKIRSLSFSDQFTERERLRHLVKSMTCTHCPELLEHFAMVHKHHRLLALQQRYQFLLSENSLALLPEYDRRVNVLQHLNYIGQTEGVLLKGRVAAEINTINELVATELIFQNALSDLDAAETIAILSSMLFQEKSKSEPHLTEKLEKAKKVIIDTAMKCAEIQNMFDMDIKPDDVMDSLNFGLVEVVYQWALGMPFKHIMTLTDTMEGSITRCIIRLNETCREIRDAALKLGDISLAKKMNEASELIKRDVVFAASLYTA